MNSVQYVNVISVSNSPAAFLEDSSSEQEDGIYQPQYEENAASDNRKYAYKEHYSHIQVAHIGKSIKHNNNSYTRRI